MKIRTFNTAQFGKKRLFGGGFPPVEFDKDGYADVSDNAGEYITKAHPNICKDGEEPRKVEIVSNVKVEGTSITSLKQEIENLNNKLASKEVQLKAEKSKLKELNESFDAYKALVDDLRKENESLKEAIATSKKNSKITEKAEEKEPETEEKGGDESIADFSLEDLRAVCKEEGFEEKEWKHLNQKALVKYLEKKDKNE